MADLRMCCAEHAEKRCDSYGHCIGCNALRYMYNDREITEAAYYRLLKGKKETDMLNLSDVKILMGGRLYPAQTVEFNHELGDYPSVNIYAKLVPSLTTRNPTTSKPLSITNVIFNPPATIVFWSDKTKTVVKCDYDHEAYDPEKGIAMAISRKMLGDNKREYYNTFLHWLKKYDKQLENEPYEYNPMNMYE